MVLQRVSRPWRPPPLWLAWAPRSYAALRGGAPVEAQGLLLRAVPLGRRPEIWPTAVCQPKSFHARWDSFGRLARLREQSTSSSNSRDLFSNRTQYARAETILESHASLAPQAPVPVDVKQALEDCRTALQGLLREGAPAVPLLPDPRQASARPEPPRRKEGAPGVTRMSLRELATPASNQAPQPTPCWTQ